jgi:hypothetical protein
LKEYNTARPCNSKQKEKHKNCVAALREKKSGGLNHNGMLSENNTGISRMHCGHVIVLLMDKEG